jgi:hypothetical protein
MALDAPEWLAEKVAGWLERAAGAKAATPLEGRPA